MSGMPRPDIDFRELSVHRQLLAKQPMRSLVISLDVGKLLREFQANQKHLRGVNGQNEKEANYYIGDCTITSYHHLQPGPGHSQEIPHKKLADMGLGTSLMLSC